MSAFSQVASAQPVLHEPVSAPTLQCAGGVCQRVGEQPGALPDAVVSDDGLIGAPLGGRSPKQNEPIFSSANQSSPLAPDLMRGAPPPGHDPPPVRRPRVAPDGETGPEPPGERAYHEIFNPAVFPYKRMTALDAVDDSGNLYIYDRRNQPLQPSGNRLIPGRDPFYGSLVVDFNSSEPASLPTPSAGVRLLSYQTTPEQPLAFYKDATDNLYAIAAKSGRYRLVFLVDADQRYFAGPLFPAALRKSVRLDSLPPPPSVPRAIRHEADKVLRHIGVRPTPSSDYAELVGRLVAYFRAFQMAELPPEEDEDGNRSSLYLRIALSQRGVCRHRSYAFVITALAAGVPVRYVENELHVFVEVYIPPIGEATGYWRRINLGGAPLQQRVFGGENREAYQEKGGDPFDRPAAFTRAAPPQVTGLPKRPVPSRSSGGSGEGSSESTKAAAEGGEGNGRANDRANKEGNLEGSRSAAASAGSGTGGETGGNQPGSGPGGALGNGPGGDGEGGEVESLSRLARDTIGDPTDARGKPGGSEPLIATHVSLAVGATRRIYRGAAVSVRGAVRTDRGSAANLEVMLLLAAPQPLVLGRTVTHSDGTFETEVEIPGGAPLGHFQLVARVRGDDKRRGSASGGYNHMSRSSLGELEFIENR